VLLRGWGAGIPMPKRGNGWIIQGLGGIEGHRRKSRKMDKGKVFLGLQQRKLEN
jgi:hypothetical protein